MSAELTAERIFHKEIAECSQCPNCREHDDGESCHAPIAGDPLKSANRINRGWAIGDRIPDWCPLPKAGVAARPACPTCQPTVPDCGVAGPAEEDKRALAFIGKCAKCSWAKANDASMAHLKARLARPAVVSRDTLVRIINARDTLVRIINAWETMDAKWRAYRGSETYGDFVARQLAEVGVWVEGEKP